MAPKTLEATSHTPPPTNPAPGSGGDGPNLGAPAQFEDGEAEALAAEDEGHILATPSKRNVQPPVPAPDVEVRADGESADDAGEKPDGESPESNGEEPAGEESDEGDAEESAVAEQFNLALKMAGGDPKKALQILQAAMGEAEKPAKVEAPKPSPFDAKAEAKQFYEDVAKHGEQEAFALHLERLAKAQEASTSEVRKELARQREIDAAAAAEIKALDKAFPAWRGDKAFMVWYDTPQYRNLPGVDAYTLYSAKRTARKGSENGATAAAKVAADKKAKMAGAAGSIPGGRPAGPNAPRPHVSAVELEMREHVRQEGGRLRALP